jgi:hypothetical protein
MPTMNLPPESGPGGLRKWAYLERCYDALSKRQATKGDIFYIARCIDAVVRFLDGQKRVARTESEDGVIIRRKRLNYEIRLCIYCDETRYGFDLHVPPTGLVVRVTSNLGDPPPFALLLKTICKIDKAVVRTRGKKWSPLDCDPARSTSFEHVRSAEAYIVSKQTQALPPLEADPSGGDI